MSEPDRLSEEQLAVVGRPVAPLIVVAAAGSGKTRVLVERFVEAVLVERIPPERLLTITFTVRAAAQLRERIAARLGERGATGEPAALQGAFIGTFHGFCAALLRAEAFEDELAPTFAVLDDGRAALLRKRAYEDALNALGREQGAGELALLAPFAPDTLRSAILDTYDRCRSRGELRPRLPSTGVLATQPEGDAAERDRRARSTLATLGRLLELFDDHYRAQKQAARGLDYDDLELRALALLRGDPKLRRRWRKRFALIMVDEYQDVNARQLGLLEALADENLLTVGDQQQSIYGFRHAEVRIFRDRAEALREQGAELHLASNYRSHPELIETLNALFAQRLGDRYVPMRAGRSAEPSERARGEQGRVELLLVDGRCSALPWPAEVDRGRGMIRTRLLEAQLLARRIAQLLEDGRLECAQIAILMRSRIGMEAYRQALEARAIPVALSPASLWGGQTARTLLNHLRAVLNEGDEPALCAALISPLCGLSTGALLGIATLRSRLGCSLEQALRAALDEAKPPRGGRRSGTPERARAQGEALSADERERLADYLRLREHARAQLLHEGIAAALRSAGELLPSSETQTVGALVASARSFERAEGPRVRSFLEYAELSAELPQRADGPAPQAQAGVRLLTIHAAKGLEFDVVCIAELGGKPPSGRPTLLAEGERVGLRMPGFAGAEEWAAFDYEELLREREEREQEEGERLLYVACTRARERLIFSGCAKFDPWPTPRPGGAHLHWLAPALAPQLPQRLARSGGLEGPLVVEGIAGSLRLELLGPEQAAALERDLRLGERLPTGGAIEADRAESERPLRADPPATLAQLIGRRELISYSSLAKLERCALRFYVEDVLRLPAPIHPASEEPGGERGQERRQAREQEPGGASAGRGAAAGGRSLGVILHRLIAAYGGDRQGARDPAEADPYTSRPERADPTACRPETTDASASRPEVIGPEAVAALARSLYGEAPSERKCVEIAQLARVALEGELARRARSAGGGHELPFLFELDREHPPIGGVFDLYARERDHALVIDYKSDHLRAGVTPEEVVRDSYALQRLLYALAALRGGASSVEVIHWFLRLPEQPAPARFERAQEGELEAQLRERLRADGARQLEPSPNPNRVLCAGCPARGGLCGWDPKLTYRAPERAL
jgi:ATP-dependent helicase/nuclease subunit A